MRRAQEVNLASAPEIVSPAQIGTHKRALVAAVGRLADHHMDSPGYRYGDIGQLSKGGCPELLAELLAQYASTHNTDRLVDIINLARVEFLYPSFDDAHGTIELVGLTGRAKC